MRNYIDLSWIELDVFEVDTVSGNIIASFVKIFLDSNDQKSQAKCDSYVNENLQNPPFGTRFDLNQIGPIRRWCVLDEPNVIILLDFIARADNAVDLSDNYKLLVDESPR